MAHGTTYEEGRLASVRSLRILDTPSDPAFDALAEEAAAVAGCPIAQITIVDADRTWFKSSIGFAGTECSREASFCTHVVASGGILVVEDALADPRFVGNVHVAREGGIRAYLGIPIVVDGVHPVGSLCVVDVAARTFDAATIVALHRLAGVVSSLIARHDENRASRRTIESQERTIRSLDERIRHVHGIFEHATTLAGMGVFGKDLATGEIVWSRNMHALVGAEDGFVPTASSGFAFIAEEDRDRLREAIAKAERDGSSYEFEGGVVLPGGGSRRIRIVADTIREDGVPVRRCGMVVDVTEEHLRRQEIARLVERDALTGLYNKRWFSARLEDLAPSPGPNALVLVDLDGFKTVNDVYGHEAGDHCLRVVARRLAACPKAGVEFARIGGDEFAVLLDLSDPSFGVDDLSRWILSDVPLPIEWHGRTLEIGTSIGISVRGRAHADAGSFYVEADLALYEAKRTGRNRAVVYAAGLREVADRRLRVVEETKTALAEGRLELRYQPVVRLADGSHGGFEALVRRREADGGLLDAEVFSDAFHDSDLGPTIGAFAVEEAFRQSAEWKRAGVDVGVVSVNLGAAQFRRPGVSDLVLGAVAKHGLSVSDVSVEIAETVLAATDRTHVAAECLKLRDAGVAIALDDFGSGHGSLRHLVDFRVDVLKMDRNFVASIDRGDAAVVDAVVSLSHTIGIEVVAEGVETVAQAEHLRRIGCGGAQGWLWSRPLAAADVPSWMEFAGGSFAEAAE